jgi:hypothetical protein
MKHLESVVKTINRNSHPVASLPYRTTLVDGEYDISNKEALYDGYNHGSLEG